ncbi:MAG: hypothetical protein O8C66_08925 [Candidatus Methanoperedens sp.]|nr:hypothetical protein [Candidatus Methanoperedens sp.]
MSWRIIAKRGGNFSAWKYAASVRVLRHSGAEGAEFMEGEVEGH